MKKIKKGSKLTALTLGVSLICFSPSLAFANEGDPSPRVTHEQQGHLDITTYYYDEPVAYDFEEQPNDGYSTMYIPYNGKEYSQTSKNLYKNKSWGTVITNDSPLHDSVTRAVSRTKFANGSIGASAETAVNWKLIQGKVGITAEAAWGKSTTTTVSYLINLPARHTTTVAIGSKAVVTTGKVLEYRSGRLYKSTVIKADYSYDEYVDKKSVPL